MVGVPLYDVQHDGRLYVRDMWCEGSSWRMFNLTGSGEFSYLDGLMNVCTDERMKTLAWEQELRNTVSPELIDGFRGKVTLALIGMNNTAMRVVPPCADLKLLQLAMSVPGRKKS